MEITQNRLTGSWISDDPGSRSCSMHSVPNNERRCSSCKHMLSTTYFDGTMKTCRSCLHKRQLRRARTACFQRLEEESKKNENISLLRVHSLLARKYCSSCKRVSLVGGDFSMCKKTCEECLEKRRRRRGTYYQKHCTWHTFLLLGERE